MNSSPREILNWESFLKLSKKHFAARMASVPLSKELPQDLSFLHEISGGSNGRIALAKYGGKIYAVKVMEKSKLVANKQVELALNEKKLLYSMNFPFIMASEFFFKDNSYIYIGLPFITGGELHMHIYKGRGGLSEPVSKFFTAQVVLALEYLQNLDIVYRDLKPENVVLDHHGYLQIVDFGFSRVITSRTFTVCGTPEYLAPEIILNKGYSHGVDWWALGVLIFEMCAARTPFYHSDPLNMYQHITSGKYQMVHSFSEELKDLIRRLLQVNPSLRLGSIKYNVKTLKAHAWFQSISWLDILNKHVKPPLVPETSGPEDISNYNMEGKFSPERVSKNKFKEEFKHF